MNHDAFNLLTLMVIMFLPLLYGAVFCRSERPMRRLIAWTEVVRQIVIVVVELLLRN